eukprot:11476375-Alexandrium_andersonii.AAC.1
MLGLPTQRAQPAGETPARGAANAARPPSVCCVEEPSKLRNHRSADVTSPPPCQRMPFPFMSVTGP